MRADTGDPAGSLPHPGLVICYSYLWLDDHRSGREEGTKNRPCAIVLTAHNVVGKTIIAVVPITHRRPTNVADGVEIPLTTKERLGLDQGQAWAIVSEVNRFVWPGPDLRPISRSQPTRFDYGVLPPALFKQIVQKLRIRAAQQRLATVPRSG